MNVGDVVGLRTGDDIKEYVILKSRETTTEFVVVDLSGKESIVSRYRLIPPSLVLNQWMRSKIIETERKVLTKLVKKPGNIKIVFR